jgi:hypothetical protein
MKLITINGHAIVLLVYIAKFSALIAKITSGIRIIF